MRTYGIAFTMMALAFFMPSLLFAQTACGEIPPPSFECPSSMTIACDFSSGEPMWRCVDAPQETQPPSDPVSPPPEEQPPASTPADPAPSEPTPTPTPVMASEPVTPTSPVFPEASAPTPEQSMEAPITETLPEDVPVPEPTLFETTPSVPMFDTITTTIAPSLPSWFDVLVGAVGMLFVTLGAQKVMSKVTKKGQRPCQYCSGRGYERITTTGECSTCNGTKLVDEEIEGSVACKHCSGSGEDPCHTCEGDGWLNDKHCSSCAGTGNQAKDEKGNRPECCTCHGQGEASAAVRRKVPCPDCV